MAMIEQGFPSLGPQGFHRIAYTEWGRPDDRRVVVCVHGLTRNGRDFDFLAESLENSFRIACPDLAGRGRSGWLPQPADYGLPVYMADMAALIARLGVDEVDWIGTSLGGLIGMALAAQPNSPIKRLVINDIGPFLPKEALQRIGEYVGTDPTFESFEAVETYMREVYAPYGDLTDAQWRHMTEHSARKQAGGHWRLHYDPDIAVGWREAVDHDLDLWAMWDAITCPVLVLRGALSDLLTVETAERMLVDGPDAEVVEIPGVGHAPALMSEEQISVIREWLGDG